MKEFLTIAVFCGVTSLFGQKIDFGGVIYGTSNIKNDAGPYSLIDSMNFRKSFGTWNFVGLGINSKMYLKDERRLKVQYRFQAQHLNKYWVYADFISIRRNHAVIINQHFHSLSIDYLIPVPKIRRLYLLVGLAARFHFIRDKKSIRIDPEKEDLIGHIQVSNSLFDNMRTQSFSYLLGLEYELNSAFSVFSNFERTLNSMLNEINIGGNSYKTIHRKSYINFGVSYKIKSF